MEGTDDAARRVIAGRYQLLRKLGAGGMGRVWLAHDQELACDVALKEIAVPAETPEGELTARIARARGEARHSARLRGNPHVVTVYDIVVDVGFPWIVIEFVSGAKDLEAVVCESGPLSPADTAKIGLAVLDALAAGHRLGILHRDVKPSNILLPGPAPHGAQLAGTGRVQLTDYGISLQEDSGESRLTSTSQIIGTTRFLAPERAHGEAATAASDLFSLGATLYFAVEGRGPFDRDTDLATFTALLMDEPAPPRRAGSLAPILLHMLAKDPEQRLPADAAARRLAQVATAPRVQPPTVPAGSPTITQPSVRPPATQPVRPPAPPAPRRAWPPWRRPGVPADAPQPPRASRRIIALTAAAVLLAGIAVWVTVAGLSGPNQPSTGPVKPYGETVGLTRDLHPGDCVSAVWSAGRFKGLPNLGTVSCAEGSERPDGQVIRTAPAISLADAQMNGDSLCTALLAATVNGMADARSYALLPSEGGWDSGMHDVACLIFNKTVAISRNVGTFRSWGEQVYPINASVGDCYIAKKEKNIGVITLAKCDTPHDEQALGFVKAPIGMTYPPSEKEKPLCTDKYGSTYVKGPMILAGYYSGWADWNNGFRYVLCTVTRTDGKKLTSNLVTHTGSASFR